MGGRHGWLGRSWEGLGPHVGRGREVTTHGRTVGAVRGTEVNGSTRPRASRTPGAYTCMRGQCGVAGRYPSRSLPSPSPLSQRGAQRPSVRR
eukprot:5987892-Pleurochrysis_carterae.AAC.2